MSAELIYGLSAWALLLGVGASLLFHKLKYRVLVLLAVTAVSLVPFWDMNSLASVCFGILSAPSVVLLFVGLCICLKLPKLECSPWILFVAAAILYMNLFGIGDVDLYGLGYGRAGILMTVVGLVGVVAIIRGADWLLIALGLALSAYAFGLVGNLWNALFDPLLVLLVLGTWIYRWVWNKAMMKKQRRIETDAGR